MLAQVTLYQNLNRIQNDTKELVDSMQYNDNYLSTCV